MSEEQIAGLKETMGNTPLGRMLVTDYMATAIGYLLSDASTAMRNAHLDIDAGFAL